MIQMNQKTNPEERTNLKRVITLRDAVIYGVGIILGAGIYALIGLAAGIAGNAVWLSFFVAAAIAGCTALSYAELSSLFPKSAAEFVYLKRATGSSLLAFLVGYLTIFTGITSVAVVALGFSTYFRIFLPISPILVSILLIIGLSIINFKGIRESAKLNTICTLITISGLLLIIVFGISYLGNVNYFETPMGDLTQNLSVFSSIIGAASLIFFAYLGFEDIANIAEETKNPSKTIPRALIYSLIITTIIYLLIALISVSVVPYAALQQAALHSENAMEGPLALVASTLLGPNAGILMSIIALFATASTVLILMIVSSRMLYGMAEERTLPQILKKVHPINRTPYVAISIVALISIIFIFIGDLSFSALLTNFGVFAVFLSVNVSLLIIRYKKNFPKPKFRAPLNIGKFPVLAFFGVISTLYILATSSEFWNNYTLFEIELPLFVFGVIFLLFGIPIYYLFNKNPADYVEIP